MCDAPKILKRTGPTIPKGAVYVGRPTAFGNPFIVGKDGTRDQVVEMYRRWINKQPDLILRVKRELKGKDLVCWCAPLRCHAEVLREIANGK